MYNKALALIRAKWLIRNTCFFVALSEIIPAIQSTSLPVDLYVMD